MLCSEERQTLGTMFFLNWSSDYKIKNFLLPCLTQIYFGNFSICFGFKFLLFYLVEQFIVVPEEIT